MSSRDRHHLWAVPDIVDGELADDPPGWWVCPTCGRRIDRADDPPAIRERWCAGGGGVRHRHPVVRMTVRR